MLGRKERNVSCNGLVDACGGVRGVRKGVWKCRHVCGCN